MELATPSPPPPAQSGLSRAWPWLVVFAVLMIAGSIRVHLRAMPLERDEGEYAYAGQLLLQGIPPYELAYNMKLPGTYFAYAAGMSVLGQTVSGIHLTLLFVNSLTCVFVFLLGRKLLGVTTGLAACACYALMSVSTTVLGLAAHATQFVVLFAVPGTILLWDALLKGGRQRVFFCGLLYGLAFVMKQQGVFFGVFGFLVLLVHERIRSGGWTKDAVKPLLLFALGASLPFLVICGYLAQAGVFSRFWFWSFSYARAYASTTPVGEGVGYLLDYLRDQFAFYAGFWLLAAAGLVAALRRPDVRQPMVFALGFLFFSFLGTVPGLYFREHYFVLLLPAFALIVGMSVQVLQARFSGLVRWSPVILLVGILGWCGWLQRWAFFKFPPAALSQMIYRDNPLLESQQAADYIREHSGEKETVAVIGSEPQIYFYAHRHSATGYIYTYPLMENQPYAAIMQRQMISEIESNRPEYLVVAVNRYSWLMQDGSDQEILGWQGQYTARYYDRIGVLDDRTEVPQVQLWGDAAQRPIPLPDQCLVIYRRKSPAN